MLTLKKSDNYFIGIILVSVCFYFILTYFNILRFESLSPLCFSPANHEMGFRWMLSPTHPIDGYIYPVEKFPPPELCMQPLLLAGAYSFKFIFWLLNSCIGLHITYAHILLITQPVFFSLAAIILYKLAVSLLNNKSLSFAITLSFLLNQLFFIGSAIGFIFNCIAIPLLFTEFFFIFNKRHILALIFLFLENAVRIDVVLINTILGFLLIRRAQDKTERKIALQIFTISLIWFIVLLVFFAPHIITTKVESHQYAMPAKEAFFYFLQHPKDIFSFLGMIVSKYFLVYLLDLAFLPLLGFEFILPILGTLPILVFKPESTGVFINLPFVYLAAIFGIRRLLTLHNSLFFRRALTTLIIAVTCLSHYFCHYAYISSSVGFIPLSRNFSFAKHLPTKRYQLGYSILKSIPQDATCFTIISLAQRLGHLKMLGIYGKTELTDLTKWDYYFFSFKELNFVATNFNYHEYLGTIRSILETQRYNVVVYKDGWLLLKKAPVDDNDKDSLQRERVLADILNSDKKR